MSKPEFYLMRGPDDPDKTWLAAQGIGEVQFETALLEVRSDIDDGASGYVMMDKDFKPTDDPPPDPPGAYCFHCDQRIRVHNKETAFLVCVGKGTIAPFGKPIGVLIRAACEECSRLTDEDLGAEDEDSE